MRDSISASKNAFGPPDYPSTNEPLVMAEKTGRPAEEHRGRFPATRKSAVLDAKSDDAIVRARAFEVLVRAYEKPVYKHVRVRWHQDEENARDLTQAFFTQAFEDRIFARYEPERALFRTFLKTLLDRFVQKHERDRRRIKRGGRSVTLSLDFESAEAELARSMPSGDGIEACFDQEWTRGLIASAVDALREACKAKGKATQLAIFERVTFAADGERPTYAELAAEHGVAVTDVTNYLSAMRRDFRRALIDELRRVTASDEELKSEARALFGIEV